MPEKQRSIYIGEDAAGSVTLIWEQFVVASLWPQLPSMLQ